MNGSPSGCTDVAGTPRTIAVIAAHSCPYSEIGGAENGGMSVYVRETAAALAARGVTSVIFTRKEYAESPSELDVPDGCHLVHIHAGPEKPLDKDGLFYHLPEFYENVSTWTRENGVAFELVQSHYWLSGWVGRRLGGLWGVPWTHMAHTLGRVKDRDRPEGAARESDQRIAVELEIVRSCNRLIAPTPKEVDDLTYLYGADRSCIDVVPLGTDLARFHHLDSGDLRTRLGLAPNEHVILFTGRLERLKGVETLIHALPLLPVAVGPHRLLVAGADSGNGVAEAGGFASERARLEALAADLGVSDQVIFLGAVPHAQLARYYSLADVCAVPSYSESFGTGGAGGRGLRHPRRCLPGGRPGARGAGRQDGLHRAGPRPREVCRPPRPPAHRRRPSRPHGRRRRRACRSVHLGRHRRPPGRCLLRHRRLLCPRGGVRPGLTPAPQAGTIPADTLPDGMRRPRAICFDMGYTLMRHTPTGPELYRQVLAENGHFYEAAALEAAHVPARQLYADATRAGRDFESSMEMAQEFWLEYTLLILNNLSLDAAALNQVAEAVNRRAWSADCWEPFADSLGALQSLRELGVRMAVISNFVDTLPSLCTRAGFDGLFDLVLASVDAGAMKPDHRIFEMALRRMGVAAGEAWHVGDNYWADVMGARAVGITPVLLDRDRLVPRADCVKIASLDELVDLVRGLEEEEAAA